MLKGPVYFEYEVIFLKLELETLFSSVIRFCYILVVENKVFLLHSLHGHSISRLIDHVKEVWNL